MLLPVSLQNIPGFRRNTNPQPQPALALRFTGVPKRLTADTFAYPADGAPRTPVDTNQIPMRVDYNLATDDAALMTALEKMGANWASKRIANYGERLGSEAIFKAGADANQNKPVLQPRTATGEDRYEVDFHPSYHDFMALSKQHRAHNMGWGMKKQGSHVARAASFYLMGQVEAGHCCPISMTHAALPLLMPHTQHNPMFAEWVSKINSTQYDGRAVPVSQKEGITLGMGLTEMQGGTDVQLNQTVARPVDGNKRDCGDEYELSGHKWFTSAPMSDGFLITAYTENGMSCFLVPRWKEDGSSNFVVKRLKDKLGDRSNASSEPEFYNSQAFLVGEEGNGIKTILQMINSTRLDCMLGSASYMRQALVQAMHFANERIVQQSTLMEKALQQNVLVDLALEVEAATLMSMYMAHNFDVADSGTRKADNAKALARIGTAIGKYWVCKRAPEVVKESMEVAGGNAYVEDFNFARLHRQSPLNGIWEGAGNVQCLEVLRGLSKPNILKAFLDELNTARGKNDTYDRYLDTYLLPRLGDVGKLMADVGKGQIEGSAVEWQLREVGDLMALGLQANIMLRYSTPEMASAFCESRLVPSIARNYGTLPASVQKDAPAILKRAYPDQ